jgi:hypothetical protein
MINSLAGESRDAFDIPSGSRRILCNVSEILTAVRNDPLVSRGHGVEEKIVLAVDSAPGDYFHTTVHGLYTRVQMSGSFLGTNPYRSTFK